MNKLTDDVGLILPDEVLAIAPDEEIGMEECRVFLEGQTITVTTFLALLQFQEEHGIKKLHLYIMDKPIMVIVRDY